MIKGVILNFLIGCLIGIFLEFTYKSIENKKFRKPLFVNYQMYGLSAVFLYFLYFLNISIIYKVILILLFMTTIEFLTGYLYFLFKKIHLWDYSNQPLNYKGFICLKFSFYWVIIALFYYYLILPFIV